MLLFTVASTTTTTTPSNIEFAENDSTIMRVGGNVCLVRQTKRFDQKGRLNFL